MDKPVTTGFWRRNLPHWRVADRPYFVTFCLKGAVPRPVALQMRDELERFLAQEPAPEALLAFRRRHFGRMEKLLDTSGCGPRWLADARIAALVVRGMEMIETSRGWDIPAAVVMPNHVHALLVPTDRVGKSLDRTVAGLKGWSAKEANRLLGRTGQAFWAAESFDHWCRTPEETERVAAYIRDNPVKAGLVSCWGDWPWVRYR